MPTNLFLYKEKIVPYSLDRKMSFFKRRFAPWKWALQGEVFIHEQLKRLTDESLINLANTTAKYIKKEIGGSLITIFSNSDYRGSFDIEGSHSDLYYVFQKGVNEKTRNSLIEEIDKIISVNILSRELGVSISDFMRIRK